MFGISIKNFYYLLNVSFVLLYVLYYSSSWDKSNEYLDKLNEIYGIFIGIVLIYYFNPYNKGKLNEFHKNNCLNSTYNGMSIIVDMINDNPNTLRIFALRSFGESLYHSITDSTLEFGYIGK